MGIFFFFYGFSNRAPQSDSLLSHQNGCLIFHYRVFLSIFIFSFSSFIRNDTTKTCGLQFLYFFIFLPPHTTPVCGGRQMRRKQYEAIKFFYYDASGGVKINAGGADVDTEQIGRWREVWFGLSGSSGQTSCALTTQRQKKCQNIFNTEKHQIY